MRRMRRMRRVRRVRRVCGGCAAGASSRPNAPRTQWRAISWPTQSNSDSISCPLRPKDRPAERYPRRHRSPRIGRHRFHRRGPCRVPRRARRRDRRARARGVRAGSAHGRAARRPDGPHVARPEVRRRVLSDRRAARRRRGREIPRLAGDEARQRGCGAAVLYTISFQAPAFYEKFGWRRFGDVRCDSRGTNRVFMTKTLRWAPAARAGVRARRGAR